MLQRNATEPGNPNLQQSGLIGEHRWRGRVFHVHRTNQSECSILNGWQRFLGNSCRIFPNSNHYNLYGQAPASFFYFSIFNHLLRDSLLIPICSHFGELRSLQIQFHLSWKLNNSWATKAFEYWKSHRHWAWFHSSFLLRTNWPPWQLHTHV